MCYYLLPVGKIRFCSLLSPGFLGDKGHRLNGTPFWVEDLVEFLVVGKVSSDLETKFKDATKDRKTHTAQGIGRDGVVGVRLGAERYAEEFSRFSTEECVLIGIFIHVSGLSGFSAFS